MIPAAGRAVRLHPLTLERPKALLDVGGQPLIHHLLDRLTPPVTDFCVVLGESGEAIKAALGDGFRGAAIHYAMQDEPRGVADAVLSARDLVSGPFVVVMGDGYYSGVLGPSLEAWAAAGTAGMVLVEPLAGSPRDPIGLVRQRQGRVSEIAKTRAVDRFDSRVAGCVGFDATAWEICSRVCSERPGECELEDVVSDLLGKGHEFAVIRYEGWRRNVNSLEDLAAVRAEHELRLRRQSIPRSEEYLGRRE
ncbi:MAG: sugar phosphate nucleotidyltransferase [Gemmatimonadales bacterium]